MRGALGFCSSLQLYDTAVPLNTADPKMIAIVVVSMNIITTIMLRLTYLRAYELTHSYAYCSYLPYGVPGTPPPAWHA